MVPCAFNKVELLEAVMKHVSNDQVWSLEESLSPQPITEHTLSLTGILSLLLSKRYLWKISWYVSIGGCKPTTGRVAVNLESVLYSIPNEYSFSFPQKVLKH